MEEAAREYSNVNDNSNYNNNPTHDYNPNSPNSHPTHAYNSTHETGYPTDEIDAVDAVDGDDEQMVADDDSIIDYSYLEELAGGDEDIFNQWRREIVSIVMGGGSTKKLREWYQNILQQFCTVGHRHCVKSLSLVEGTGTTTGAITSCAASSSQDQTSCIK